MRVIYLERKEKTPIPKLKGSEDLVKMKTSHQAVMVAMLGSSQKFKLISMRNKDKNNNMSVWFDLSIARNLKR